MVNIIIRFNDYLNFAAAIERQEKIIGVIWVMTISRVSRIIRIIRVTRSTII
jgi:hypothetical protein